jgi:hypothetical protein
VLAFNAEILWRRTGTETMVLGAIAFGLADFLAAPFLTRLLNRDVIFQNLDPQIEDSACIVGMAKIIRCCECEIAAINSRRVLDSQRTKIHVLCPILERHSE